MKKTNSITICNTCHDLDVSGHFIGHLKTFHPEVDRTAVIEPESRLFLDGVGKNKSAIAIRTYTTKEGYKFTVTVETRKV